MSALEEQQNIMPRNYMCFQAAFFPIKLYKAPIKWRTGLFQILFSRRCIRYSALISRQSKVSEKSVTPAEPRMHVEAITKNLIHRKLFFKKRNLFSLLIRNVQLTYNWPNNMVNVRYDGGCGWWTDPIIIVLLL